MHHQRLVSLTLVALLVGSGLGVAASASMASQGAQVDHQRVQTDRGAQTNQTGSNVTALDAVELVQNRTEETVIGVRLLTRNGTTAYNVTLLSENLSVSVLTVSGVDPSVTVTDRSVTVVERRFVGGEAFDYDELRPADEAIRLIQNETNGTVIHLGLRRGQLVYGVALETPDGPRTRALVAATDDPILGIQRARTPPTMRANQTTTSN